MIYLSRFGTLKENFDLWEGEKYLVAYQKYADNLNDLMRNCDNVVDLRNIFDDLSEPIFLDHTHLSNLGAKTVAKKLFELSMPLIKKS